MDNDQVKDNYKKIMSAVNNASGPHFEIGQLRGEIWKLCCNLAQYEYQPPQDLDFSFWHTTVERAGTTYTLVLAHSDIEPPFLYEVQVNGSNIFDVLSDDVKDHFECIAYKEMMIGEEA